ncbi:MAG: hypothetical protein RIN55_08735 [Tissierellaceae bacterium]|nr:hypothetical protein [Tissierellaceae bacterium]
MITRYGGDNIDLIYIIDPYKYRQLLEKGINKYLFKFVMPLYKANKIHDIIIEDNIIGHIYGINLKPLDFNNDENIEEYILNIKNVMDDEYGAIYIEEKLPLDVLEIIQSSLDVINQDDNDIRIFNIPFIIEALMLKMKRDIIKEEILIITNDKEEALKIIDLISNKFNFISVLGLNELDGESVYEEVLENTGISVYLPQSSMVSLRRYGLIINTLDNPSISLKGIRNNAIVIDFSSIKPFKGINKYVIEDLSFDLSDLGLNDNPWIDKEVKLNLYSCLFKGKNRRFCRVFNNGGLISIENFVNQGLKIKGGL